jgi:hypothetical protein
MFGLARLRPRLIALIIVLVLVAAGALVLNVLLSSAYSPQSAVRDYFAAQQRGDAAAMWANARYVHPDGAYGAFFDRTALAAMMKVKANANLRNLRVGRFDTVDSSSKVVTVSMTWNGQQISQPFRVREDSGDVHWLLYPSWKIDIPSREVRLGLPYQAAPISLDGIAAPQSSQNVFDAIMGFHNVMMDASSLLKSQQVLVDARQEPASATVPGTLQDARLADIRKGIRDSLEACDPARYQDCVNHTYSAPDRNYVWIFMVPGTGNVDWTTYRYTERGDLGADVSVTIEAADGLVDVQGTCAETLTINGTRTFALKGDYGGTMRWDGNAFTADTLGFDCARDKG